MVWHSPCSSFEHMQIKNESLQLESLELSLPMRTDLHLMRKVWHMSTGLIMVSCLLAGMNQSMALILLGAALVFSILMEVFRLSNAELNKKCIRFFGNIIRSNEVNKVSGMPYYIASSFLAVAIFPRPVAILAILYLALGDPLSSLVGILYSSRSVKIFKGKSLHGTAAGFAVCAISTWIFLRSTEVHGLALIRLTLLGGFAGALAELLPFEIDDNFTIPMISGFILWMGMIAVHFV